VADPGNGSCKVHHEEPAEWVIGSREGSDALVHFNVVPAELADDILET
jgi:hypothetical protein